MSLFYLLWVKSSPVMSQGMEPGPKAKNTTNNSVATIAKIPAPLVPLGFTGSGLFVLLQSTLSRSEMLRAIVIRIEQTIMPIMPTKWMVLRPSLSIKGMVTMVMVTMMAPTPRVAYWELLQLIPALWNQNFNIFMIILFLNHIPERIWSSSRRWPQCQTTAETSACKWWWTEQVSAFDSSKAARLTYL